MVTYRKSQNRRLDVGVSLAGVLMSGLLILFNASPLLWGLAILMVVHLGISGTAALFLVNVELTGIFCAAVVGRAWPQAWRAYVSPVSQPQTWAVAVAAIWLVAVCLSVLVGWSGQRLIYQRIGWQERLLRLLPGWLGGLYVGRLLSLML